jgi:hypothetical protein
MLGRRACERAFAGCEEEALERVAFAGGWKAQGPDDDHALVLWVELTQDLLQAPRAMVVGRKMDNERSAFRSKEEVQQ